MKHFWSSGAVALASFMLNNFAAAQVVVLRPAAVASAPPSDRLAPPMPTKALIPEGTEVRVRFDDDLSSASSSQGDTFSITTEDEIRLPDGTIIPAGYRGKGEVTDVAKKGMMGKAGQLNVRLDYFRIGETRVRLRASKGAEGKDAVTSTIVLTVLFGPLGLIKHGHDVVIPRGQTIAGYVDDDTEVAVPFAPPPRGD